jgi:hypothetical protein
MRDVVDGHDVSTTTDGKRFGYKITRAGQDVEESKASFKTAEAAIDAGREAVRKLADADQ